METGFLHLHKLLRYPLLICILITAVSSIYKWIKKEKYTKRDNILSLISLILVHIQVLMGLGLYFTSPKGLRNFQNFPDIMSDSMSRFFAVEHISAMILAAILVTVGRSLAKKGGDDLRKHKRTAIFFTLSLLLILVAIPWPFRGFGNTWY